VGGAVRDAGLRGMTARSGDLDVTVESGALALAREVAARLGGAFVPLDPERGTARVLVRGACLDLADWRAPTLEGDLAARDFTVNALAVELRPLLRDGRAPVIDPTGGLADLRARRLRVPDPRVLLDDPLRAVAGADELVAWLPALRPFGEELAAHLAGELGGGVTRRQILKLAALLHDVAKPETRRVIDGRVRFFEHDVIGAAHARRIGDRLKLPTRARGVLEQLVRHHLRLMHLAAAGGVTRRARYRFFRDLRDDARDLLLLSLA